MMATVLEEMDVGANAWLKISGNVQNNNQAAFGDAQFPDPVGMKR